MADQRPDRRFRGLLNDMSASETPREDIEIPIGRGNLYVAPTVTPNVTELEAGIDHPVGRGTIGAHGYVRQNTGDDKKDWGAGLRWTEKFSKGGSVKHGSDTCIACKNKFS